MNMGDESSSMVLEKDWDKFPGHILPACVFVGMGGCMLLKTLKHAKELPAGRTFTQLHVPYRQLRTTRNVGISVMACAALGALYHSLGEGIDMSIGIHMTLYYSFFLIGLASFLESKKLLMPDSGRAALALGMFLNSFIWNAHGMMMMQPVNRNVHVYLGYICLADAFAFGYSIMRTDSIIAHLAGWSIMVVKGFWLLYIAFYLCCVEISEHMVEAHLCGIIISVAILVAVVIASADLPHVRESHTNYHTALEDGRGDYEVLAKINTTGSSNDTLDSQESGDDNC